jgi:hypothetical protein
MVHLQAKFSDDALQLYSRLAEDHLSKLLQVPLLIPSSGYTDDDDAELLA